MEIAQKYSHLNGEEYLIVHHKKLYKEIIETIESIDASKFMTKESNEKTMSGKMLYSPIELNKTFNTKFNKLGWNESRYQYYITTEQKLLPGLILLPYEEQKEFLISKGIKSPISSYKQTDFVKDQIAVEVQFGKNRQLRQARNVMQHTKKTQFTNTHIAFCPTHESTLRKNQKNLFFANALRKISTSDLKYLAENEF
ncbi:MAG: hypothetical protein K8H86_06400 [Ignavibacteriaceae bacterium]|nr:hypothetical protein [Ignavibacteriaceae bacterium]